MCACRCIPGSYTSPTGRVRVDFESSPNEQRVVTDPPSHLIDDSVRLVKLDHLTVSVAYNWSLVFSSRLERRLNM